MRLAVFYFYNPYRIQLPAEATAKIDRLLEDKEFRHAIVGIESRANRSSARFRGANGDLIAGPY